MTAVAFLGLGRMGAAMAAHLTADHDVTVWNRTPKQFAGARVAGSIQEAVGSAEVIVLMLFGPDSVREVLAEVVEHASPNTLIIDATTIGPQAAQEFARTAAAAGLRYLDAPVAGSVTPATDGTLGVLVGADEGDYDQALELLRAWGDPDKIRHVGPVGAGNALKLVVNQGIGVLAAGLGEALALAGQLGLDRTVTLDVLQGAMYGWTLNQKRPAVESGDYSQTQFSLDLLVKDLELAVGAGADAELALTRAALSDARSAVDVGHGGQDYAVVIGHLADEGRADSY